jgi:hypothetical protein
LNSYVTSQHKAVVTQPGAKDKFYCTVYYITLNSNREAKGLSQNLKKS